MPDTIAKLYKLIKKSTYDELDICFYQAKSDGNPDDSFLIYWGSDLTKYLLRLERNVEKVTLFLILKDLSEIERINKIRYNPPLALPVQEPLV